MDLDIKAYFHRQRERSRHSTNWIETNFNDFVQYFKKRYPKDEMQAQLAQVLVKSSASKCLYEVEGKPKIKIIYNLSDRLEYCSYLDSESVNYKPSFLYRATMKKKIIFFSSQPQEKLDERFRPFLTQLSKILYHHPVLLPFTLFQRVS